MMGWAILHTTVGRLGRFPLGSRQCNLRREELTTNAHSHELCSIQMNIASTVCDLTVDVTFFTSVASEEKHAVLYLFVSHSFIHLFVHFFTRRNIAINFVYLKFREMQTEHNTENMKNMNKED